MSCLLDVMLPQTSGSEVFDRIRKFDAKLPVIFITASGDSETAIEAMKGGAYDYLYKPLDVFKVRQCVGKALEMRRLMHVPVLLPTGNDGATDSDALVGCSPQMLDVYKSIGRVAPQDVTVLITGESGTGKELIARAIYQHSQRAGRRFWRSTVLRSTRRCWKASCSATRRARSPAPTSAASASSNTARAARCFSTKSATCRRWCRASCCEFCRSSGSSASAAIRRSRSTPACWPPRIATWPRWWPKARFARIFIYRLNGFTIELPPFCHRDGDVQLLIEHLLPHLQPQNGQGRAHDRARGLGVAVAYPWPGNVRELQSVIKQAVLQTTGPVVLAEFLAQVGSKPRSGFGVPGGQQAAPARSWRRSSRNAWPAVRKRSMPRPWN